MSSGNRNYGLTRPQRCCSFCRRPGHAVTRCDSDRIIEFEIMCELEVRSMNTLDEFKEWLTQNYINNSHLLRAFAVTKLRSNSRVTVLESIDLISQYIFETYKSLPVETAPVEEEGVLPDNIEEDLMLVLSELRNIEHIQPLQEVEPVYNEQFVSSRRREYMRYMADVLVFTMLNNMLPTDGEEPLAIGTRPDIRSSIDDKFVEDPSVMANECSICWDKKESGKFVKLNCNHEFCNECVIKTLAANKHRAPCCALCRADINNITSRNVDVQNEISNAVA
jgi:hypothetical protein